MFTTRFFLIICSLLLTVEVSRAFSSELAFTTQSPSQVEDHDKDEMLLRSRSRWQNLSGSSNSAFDAEMDGFIKALPKELKMSCAHLAPRYKDLHRNCLEELVLLNSNSALRTWCRQTRASNRRAAQLYIESVKREKRISEKFLAKHRKKEPPLIIQGVAVVEEDLSEGTLDRSHPEVIKHLGSLEGIADMEQSFSFEEWPTVLMNNQFRDCLRERTPGDKSLRKDFGIHRQKEPSPFHHIMGVSAP